jgi:ABC-type multidrug transport system fused ATPase/permease subunit
MCRTQSPPNDSPKLALSHIDLAITAGEKVAICGRTGSGKSSLIALLLKLLDPLSGIITIDDIPLNGIDRSTLRQRIIAMPQEAVFLPAGTTFHMNLDPSEISTMEECETVLSTVGLSAFVQERGGLTAAMDAGTLSAGQRQLMSLGRVLVRRRIRARSMNASVDDREGGILVLDEVSSNVDQDTERVMQDIIKRYTVIAVSHRLNMIMDFDRVVVMEEGKIVEIGNPVALRRQETSRFGDLLKAGGY